MDHIIPTSKWIWIGDAYDKENPVMVYFRRELTLDTCPDTAKMQLSADSRYRFFVNGVSLCQGPCKGDGQIWYYDEIDLAPHLKIGKMSSLPSCCVIRGSTATAITLSGGRNIQAFTWTAR